MGTAFFFCSSPPSSIRLTFQDCPFSCLGRPRPRPRPRFCTSTGLCPPFLHPLPTFLPFTALLSPLRQSTVLHFEPSAGQVKAKANKQPAVIAGNILWGVRPSRQQPLQARRRLPRYLNPTELIYPSLCQGHRAHEPMLQSFNAHSEQRPKITRTHCRHSQPPNAEAHSSPTTPRQPGLTDFTASTRTYVATQPAVHSAAREISLAQAASSGAPGTGSSELLPPNDCSLAGD